MVVTGPTVAQAFTELYYLERAAMFQVHARSTGGKLRAISDKVRDDVKGQMQGELSVLSDRHFTALKRILDNQEPAYRM